MYKDHSFISGASPCASTVESPQLPLSCLWKISGSALNFLVAREYRSPLYETSPTRREPFHAEKSWTFYEFFKVMIYLECFTFYYILFEILF